MAIRFPWLGKQFVRGTMRLCLKGNLGATVGAAVM